jgi:hypothetical protein
MSSLIFRQRMPPVLKLADISTIKFCKTSRSFRSLSVYDRLSPDIEESAQ